LIVEGPEGDILDVGGRWDRREKRYSDAATDVRVIRPHPGQIEACEFYARWLDRYRRGEHLPPDKRTYSVILSGGQRAGKTWLATCVFAPAFAIAIPGSYVWIVCPTDADFEEVEDNLIATLPEPWYRWQKSRNRFTVVNGSRIVLRSAHRAEALKKGRCDLPVLNECQQMEQKAFAIARARIADTGGLVIGCANPPDKPIGEWVGDWVAEADAGSRNAKHYWFNPFDNPHIDPAPLLALKAELDPRTYEAEVLGRFLSIGDTVLYNWDRLENETTMERLADRQGVAELRDITPEVTEHLEGRPFARIVGVDVQRRPMASVELRCFENPLAAESDRSSDAWWRWCLVVVTDECILEGDEDDLAIAWASRGWEPGDTLIVCDASGRWQFAERNPLKVQAKREEVKGRGSWAVFQAHGYRHIRPPDRGSEKNPDVIERVRAATARIETKAAGRYGQRFLFSLARCRQTNRTIRSWPNLHGKPSRTSQHAHVGDALTYPIHRLWTRRGLEGDSSGPGVKVIKRFQRRSQMAKW
jgi:hypothetical protein